MIKGIRYFLNYASHRRFIRKAGVNEHDVFLASVPRSGNTWLRFILARALYEESQIDFGNINTYFPTAHRSTPEEISKLNPPRYIKTHAAFFPLYPKCVYIYRDYRAVVVSSWFYAKNKTGFKGSLADFISGPLLNTFGPWHWHVEQALLHKEKYPEKTHLLQYEKLAEQTIPAIKELLAFCKISPIISPEEIREKTSFGKLRKGEGQSGSRVQDSSGQFFFRSGTTDDWKQHLSPEDEKRILDFNTKRIMIRCGYIQP